MAMAALSDLLQPLEGRSVATSDLARLAGLHVTHLYDLLAGRKVPSPATRAKIRFAVNRIRLRQAEAGPDLVASYRMALALAAVTLGSDPGLAQVSDPQGRQVSSKAWREAAEARRLAQYLLNAVLGLPQAEVARISGVTKQAVSKAMREIEDAREDQAFDAKVAKLEQWILGAM
jgi:hypothetical protein